MDNTNTKKEYILDPQTGFLTDDSAKKYFSRFGWFAFALVMIYTSVASFVVRFVAVVSPSVIYSPLFSELISVIPLYCVATPIAYRIIKALPSEKPIKTKMGGRAWFFGFCICMTLLIGGNSISNFFINFVESSFNTTTSNPVNTVISSMPVWLNFLSIVVIAPIFEELLFRGVVCKRLLVLGDGYAILLSASLFALIHGNFYQLFYSFILGCFFAFIYAKTGKLIYTIAYHMAVNFFGGFISVFLLRYIDLEALLEGSVDALIQDALPIMLFFGVQLFIYVTAFIGLVTVIKKFREFKLSAGILPPPKEKRVSNLLLNSGIAAAIAVFSLNLVFSLF